MPSNSPTTPRPGTQRQHRTQRDHDAIIREEVQRRRDPGVRLSPQCVRHDHLPAIRDQDKGAERHQRHGDRQKLRVRREQAADLFGKQGEQAGDDGQDGAGHAQARSSPP